MAKEKSIKPKTEGKLSYEELEKTAAGLNNQCKQLYQQLMEARQIISEFNVIGVLLDILGKSEHFSEEFIQKCATRIEEVVTANLTESPAAPEESKE